MHPWTLYVEHPTYNWPFEGKHTADLARDEIEFDTPVLVSH